MRAISGQSMVLALAFFTLAGCHEAGHIDLPGNYGSAANEIVGEVINVDNRSREIEIRADSGRTSMVRYDNNTQVLYRQRTYPVANLERGDYVAARVQQDRDGRYPPTRSACASRHRTAALSALAAWIESKDGSSMSTAAAVLSSCAIRATGWSSWPSTSTHPRRSPTGSSV